MSREALLPGGTYMNETTNIQAQVPGDGFVNETIDSVSLTFRRTLSLDGVRAGKRQIIGV